MTIHKDQDYYRIYWDDGSTSEIKVHVDVPVRLAVLMTCKVEGRHYTEVDKIAYEGEVYPPSVNYVNPFRVY